MRNFNHLYWLYFGDSFIELAKVGCENFLRMRSEGKNSFQNDLLYKSNKALLAIFYCVNHSVEVYLKACNVNLGTAFKPVHTPVDSLLNMIDEGVGASAEIEPVVSRLNDLLKDDLVIEIVNKRSDHYRYPSNIKGEHSNVTEDVRVYDERSIRRLLDFIEDFRTYINILESRVTRKNQVSTS